MDIGTALLPASGFKILIYEIPPKEERDLGGLWKLLAAAYGLVDSSGLWYSTSDHAIVDEHKLTKSKYDHTWYYLPKADGVFRLSWFLKWTIMSTQ